MEFPFKVSKKTKDVIFKLIKKKPLIPSSMIDLIKEGSDVSELVNLEYKKYPSHIKHWDKSSKEYIHAELEEE